MLAHWLQPDQELLKSKWAPYQLGSKITSFFPEMAELPPGAVALLGFDEKSSHQVRQQLYALTGTFDKLPIIDIGNLRKSQHTFAVQVLRELIDGGLTVVILGAPADLALSQYQAYSEKIKGINACIVDARPRYEVKPKGKELPLLNRMLKPGENHIFHLSLLGYQRHLSDPAVLNKFREELHFELYPLGQLKQDVPDIEPAIRDADMLAINFSAVQAGFAPAALQPGPNGLDGMEICHLTRFAGISDKLSSLSIGGWSPHKDKSHLTAQLIAQAVWYFLEGVSQRLGDFPISMEGLIEYHVDHSHVTEPLVFWKSSRTGRWWIQVPVREDAGHARHRLVPCTYKDYQNACNDELPERLLQAQLRFR